MRSSFRILLGSSLVAAAAAAGAGTVDVTFLNARNYWDAGTTAWDEDANLKTLASHLGKLGQRWLPANQVLKVEVLQVKLAGNVQPFHGGTPVRVLNGGADWPKLQLRYSLQANGSQPIATGEEWISELAYFNGMAAKGDSDSLFYEKRMLTNWFKKRFVDGLASPG